MVDGRVRRRRVTVAIGVLVLLVVVASALVAADRPGTAALIAGTPRSTAAGSSPAIASRPSTDAAPSPITSAASPGGATAALRIALVPVVAPDSPRRAITRADLVASFTAGGRSIAVSGPDLEPLSAALGVAYGPRVDPLAPDAVVAAVLADPTTIGVLRAVDVTPAVRALSVDGRALFGAERVRSLDAWPLTVAETTGTATAGDVFDPATAWTLVAGGDVMLDRAVYRQAVLLGKGAGFPWDGGTAEVVGRRCCGAAGALLPVGRRSGNEGAVRSLLGSADLALVNLEGPAPDAFAYHPGGLVFTFDPALLAGLGDAGVDAVSLANNHISNAGATGISQTVHNLDAAGLAHTGAGTALAAARRPAIVSAGPVKVAILGYDATRPDLAATVDRAGAAPLRLDLAAADIAAVREAGADVVLVVVHWGTEYSDAVSGAQRRLAAGLVAAGADAVIGSHPHWLGAVETIDGRPVLYSLGDLVFELTHDRRTMESALADLTFVGRRLVQLDLHPTLILDGAQPNLLDPSTGDGAAVLADVRRATVALGSR